MMEDITEKTYPADFSEDDISYVERVALEIAQLQEAADQAKELQASLKDSAITKLLALGLTSDEVSALFGV